MDRGGPGTAGLGGPLRVSSEALGAPRGARAASWLEGGVMIGVYPARQCSLWILTAGRPMCCPPTPALDRATSRASPRPRLEAVVVLTHAMERSSER